MTFSRHNTSQQNLSITLHTHAGRATDSYEWPTGWVRKWKPLISDQSAAYNCRPAGQLRLISRTELTSLIHRTPAVIIRCVNNDHRPTGGLPSGNLLSEVGSVTYRSQWKPTS